jgi:hypothetical protein
LATCYFIDIDGADESWHSSEQGIIPQPAVPMNRCRRKGLATNCAKGEESAGGGICRKKKRLPKKP